jgi:acetyl-CoA C-acetyltransferase
LQLTKKGSSLKLGKITKRKLEVSMRRAVVVSAKRTAIGSFGGVFKDVSAVNLGVTVLKAILGETGIKPELIDEVIIGNVCGAGYGQTSRVRSPLAPESPIISPLLQ